ncbi:unnamed protein product [Heligmosomoides polygyrus]|uniref:Endo/exonuclease/phosphatase domain-containing protein n=1 Tax=Heligmosomoides polygyrus TaxID=6339 RepID=A0A183GRM7_HELPZ|nr:unnamed protein product [Heligmosomoides polygyrus]
MEIVSAAKERLYHFFSVYALQTGCSDQAKDEFWNLLDEKTAEVPSKDAIIVASDLNGHIGKMRGKKSLYHVFLGEKTAVNWRRYQEATKAAKKAVAVAKATHYEDVNEKLESRYGERYLCQLAKFRHRQTEDIEKFFGINDENGRLLMERKKALKRWRDYLRHHGDLEELIDSIKANGIELPRTAVFKYVGSAVASDGKLIVEVNSRAAWSKWRSLTGVFCDKKIRAL